MKNSLFLSKKIFLILPLILILISIRIFEKILFYDPFIYFFKDEFLQKSLPEFSSFKLILNLSVRYTLNTLISLIILFVLFKDKNILRISLGLYLLFFVFLIFCISVLLHLKNPDYMILFYVRRFLIQPLFLLIFIPGFYYQKVKKK